MKSKQSKKEKAFNKATLASILALINEVQEETHIDCLSAIKRANSLYRNEWKYNNSDYVQVCALRFKEQFVLGLYEADDKYKRYLMHEISQGRK